MEIIMSNRNIIQEFRGNILIESSLENNMADGQFRLAKEACFMKMAELESLPDLEEMNSQDVFDALEVSAQLSDPIHTCLNKAYETYAPAAIMARQDEVLNNLSDDEDLPPPTVLRRS